MTLEKVMRQINEKTKEEQVRILRKNRAELLEEIHCKHQLLDQLDYMLYELRNK